MLIHLFAGCSRVQLGLLLQRGEKWRCQRRVDQPCVASDDCAPVFPQGGRSAQGSSVDSQFCSCWSCPPDSCRRGCRRGHFIVQKSFLTAPFAPPVLPTAPVLPVSLQQTAPPPIMMFLTLGMCFDVTAMSENVTESNQVCKILKTVRMIAQSVNTKGNHRILLEMLSSRVCLARL